MFSFTLCTSHCVNFIHIDKSTMPLMEAMFPVATLAGKGDAPLFSEGLKACHQGLLLKALDAAL